MNLFYWAGIALTGSAIGFLTGLMGIGGGFILTPVLRILFKVPYNIAVGTGLCLIAVTGLFSMVHHLKQKHVKFRLALFLLLGSIPGSEAGVQTLVMISKHHAQNIDLILHLSFIFLLVLAAITMAIEIRKWSVPDEKGEPKTIRNLQDYQLKFSFLGKSPAGAGKNETVLNVPVLVLAGLFIGFVSGFLGTGGGFLLTPILVALLQVPAVIAVGSGLFQMTLTSAFAAGSHLLRGNVDFQLWLTLVLFSVAATRAGARYSDKLRGPKIRLCFAGILLLALVILLWDLAKIAP